MDQSKPWVQAACVCERVLQEPDNVITLVRMVDVLNMKAVPLPEGIAKGDGPRRDIIQIVDLAVVVTLKSVDLKGDFKLSVVMEDPKHERIPLLTESPVVLKGNDGVNAMLKFGLPYSAPTGRYWFDVLWDGEVLTRIPFTLNREGAEDPPPPTS